MSIEIEIDVAWNHRKWNDRGMFLQKSTPDLILLKFWFYPEDSSKFVYYQT